MRAVMIILGGVVVHCSNKASWLHLYEDDDDDDHDDDHDNYNDDDNDYDEGSDDHLGGSCRALQ